MTRVALLGATALAGALTLMASPVAAQVRSYDFDIPAQPLDTALRQYSRETSQQLIFADVDVRGRRAQALTGTHSAEEALEVLLAGTDLKVRRTALGVLQVAADTAPQSESAAGGGAEVEALIVTAQKREEDIQDVPIAISAFTQEDLTRSQIAGGPDLMTQVPNMTFTKTNFNSYSIQLRGIGTQAISATTDPAVAVAFNNTPFVRNHFFEQEFYDLERVEVLRGPQGTLYGRNATAGVVNVISAKPKFRFEAKASADVANYSSTRIEGMVNLPLVQDKAALRIAGAWTKRDGFVANALTGEQTDGRDLWSGRVSLAIEPSDTFRADLIYERFEEDDDRLRSGKQLCKKDPGPSEVGGRPVDQASRPLDVNASYFSQGCLPTSMYSPEAFQTPNGYALPYYGPAGSLGSPVKQELDPYASAVQSRDLREIETHIKPEYAAEADLVQLQLRLDLAENLSLSSETGYARDFIFSYQDFNRFDTTPDVFIPGAGADRFDVISADGIFCDPQLGCTNRLAGADLATARSRQFSQEFRISSDYKGAFNFNLGGNFLRYDTEDKYYVFFNSLTAFVATGVVAPWTPGVSDNSERMEFYPQGYAWSDPNRLWEVGNGDIGQYIDPNDIHNLNDQGRNYFLSKNPYSLLSYSLFGEAYYQLAPSLKLTGGFRWTVDRKSAPQHPSWLLANHTYGTRARKVIEQEWQEPTGRIAVDWQPELSFTDDTLVYASYVRGYKAGGANPPPPVPVIYTSVNPEALVTRSLTSPEVFAPEFVNAFELGSKNTLLDDRLTLNVGAFYYDYEGYQISQIVNRSAVNLNFDAAIWGAEVEIDWRPRENLRFGLKGGYENTRLADGSEAIDLIDRTAGNPDFMLFRPFPPLPSNCVVPTWIAAMVVGTAKTSLCEFLLVGVDPFTNLPYTPNPTEAIVRFSPQGPVIGPIEDANPAIDMTGYPGFDPSTANNGEGLLKNISGNELPNAPDFTVTVTADYTLPLPNDWMMTLHTDLYYQSEAWTRIFNMEGYDKLKAYTNINLSAIFNNEDAGWSIMAYVKNLMDRDSITGAFLSSDDTGLTTNVFLTEPRLYGLRVTKRWTGGGALGGLLSESDHYPLRVDVGGYHGSFSQDHERLVPTAVAYFPDDLPYPLDIQEDIDWGSAGELAVTWQPQAQSWFVRGAARHGRAEGADSRGSLKHPGVGSLVFGNFAFVIDPAGDNAIYNYATSEAQNGESHTIVDFSVGREFGLGSLRANATSSIAVGLKHVDLGSSSVIAMHGGPDLEIPAEFDFADEIPYHRFHAEAEIQREFVGSGAAIAWEASVPLMGDREAFGAIGLDVGLTGAMLWGRQTSVISGEIRGSYVNYVTNSAITPAYTTALDEKRTKDLTVPSGGAKLGLSYELGRIKVSGGYRWERFFDAIDGGIETHQLFDRDLQGAYFKLSVGFGG